MKEIFPWENFEKNRTLRKMGAMKANTVRPRPEWFNSGFEEEYVSKDTGSFDDSPELQRENYYGPIYKAAHKIDKSISREEVYNWLNDIMDDHEKSTKYVK